MIGAASVGRVACNTAPQDDLHRLIGPWTGRVMQTCARLQVAEDVAEVAYSAALDFAPAILAQWPHQPYYPSQLQPFQEPGVVWERVGREPSTMFSNRFLRAKRNSNDTGEMAARKQMLRGTRTQNSMPHKYHIAQFICRIIIGCT